MEHPELYGRFSGPMESSAAKALDAAWPLLRWKSHSQTSGQTPALPVLDVGCGTGDVAAKVLAPWLPRGTRIVSCDVSAEMLRYARDNNRRACIAYEQLDITDPLLEQSAVWKRAPYCKAFAFLLLHWVPDNSAALANIHKLLAPGGEAVFTIVTRVATYDVYDKMAQDPCWAPYLQDRQRFESPYRHSEEPARDFQELLQVEGFEALLCRVTSEAAAFATEHQVRVVLRAVNPFVSRVPEPQRAAFMEETFQLFRELGGVTTQEDPVTRDTSCRYHFTLLTAVARKTAKLGL